MLRAIDKFPLKSANSKGKSPFLNPLFLGGIQIRRGSVSPMIIGIGIRAPGEHAIASAGRRSHGLVVKGRGEATIYLAVRHIMLTVTSLKMRSTSLALWLLL